MYITVSALQDWKTMCEKEKLLGMSDFCFPLGVFNRLAELSAIFFEFKIAVCETL